MLIVRRLLSLFICVSAVSSPADGAEPAPLFATHDVLQVHIDAPIDTIMRMRDDEEYRDGILQYTDDAGATHTLDVKIRARGKYRRRDDVCQFAPLRLNFKKDQLDGTVFAGQNKLKLVTHCRSRSSYEQYVLKEYLAYRIFQALTDNSFSVRLLRVQWVDSDSPREDPLRYAFVIEDDDRLAERLGMRVAEVRRAGLDELLPSPSSMIAVFQLLIGNTDYSLRAGPADESCCHNAVLFEQAPGRYLPIPYDFDFSGFVDAPYAEPNPKLPIRSVRTRLYRGYCEMNAEIPATLQHFRDRETDIRALLENQEGLEPRTRDRANRFVDKFYDIINNPSRVDRSLTRKCT